MTAAILQRGPRQMPSLWKIVTYWDERGTFGKAGLDDIPHCFRCLREVPGEPGPTPRETWNAASRYLDRAHLVDRAEDGLDGPQNLVPLCHDCHDSMPLFEVPDGDIAIGWVLAGWELCLWIPREARIKAGLYTDVTDWPGHSNSVSRRRPLPQ